ncbi:hypothetical protein EZ428_05290 [Pedobacter frigiditerrae]|uniref:Uncharacterized protein n=1 Tax=Pedobacter frigiditerrae TaxID=2530452 RepID=A0A4R0N7G7_9SPHI|nr:hypothetical protein [Pedobacter frigiditerrae]TCC94194.1 hypothetical protein EZ428_05290 [Pedobacter frigiditerrae]
MRKFTFNEAGFQALQQELYQLNNDMLAAEAYQIKNAFAAWVLSKFELAQSQIDFLNKLNEAYVVFMAEQTSFAVGNRLPVSLAKEEAPANGDDQGKIVYTKSSLTASNAHPSGFAAGGELLFMISYTG